MPILLIKSYIITTCFCLIIVDSFFFFFIMLGKCCYASPAPREGRGYVGLTLFNGPYPLKPQRVSYLRLYWGRAGIIIIVDSTLQKSVNPA